MTDLNGFARQYIEVWNEPDADVRRASIAKLFAEDAVHFSPSQEVRGHDELAVRIENAYRQWVEPGEHVFRSQDNATGHHNVMRFNWGMVRQSDGETISVGFDLFVLAEDGRIQADYQFVDR
ncbi:MAG TPA: nuclear transport factor 2 family protein [Pseudonocardiaceae bacterium]|nr:nuclear transport factor 2 family protein [Pseudonocardiaceae bacterium]